MKDFKIVPDELQDRLISGEINIKNWMVAIWIYVNTNRFNGYCVTSYQEIASIFKGLIEESNARTIFRKLRHLKIITFKNHKGVAGKFKVWPNKIIMYNKKIQLVVGEQGEVKRIGNGDKKDDDLDPPSELDHSQLTAEIHNLNDGKAPELLPESDPINSRIHNHQERESESDEDSYNDTNDALPEGKALSIYIAMKLGEPNVATIEALEKQYSPEQMLEALESTLRRAKRKGGDDDSYVENPAAYFTTTLKQMKKLEEMDKTRDDSWMLNFPKADSNQ